jgi:SAM-dependent methyltransferase
VSQAEIDELLPGPPVARYGPKNNWHEMRHYICKDLRGEGVEFGAGASPMAVPLDTVIRYADRFHKKDFVENSSAARADRTADFMHIDIVDNFESMSAIDKVDFIIGSHVIEHVSDPIGVLFNAALHLRTGGKLVLVVPDKERTFDRSRPLTSLTHLMFDHFQPSRGRDLEHYLEMEIYVLHNLFNPLDAARAK